MTFSGSAVIGMVFFSIATFAPCLGQDLSSLKSLTVLDTGNRAGLLRLPEEKPVVLLLLGTDCPITQKYIPTIERLRKSFNSSVAFVGIFPKQYAANEVAAFVREYGLSFPCFIDHQMKIISLTGATVTPEAFLLSPQFQPIYSGAIDNWFYELGSYRTVITEHYLKDAIDSHLQDSPVGTRRTTAIGCLIPAGDRSQSAHEKHGHH